MPATAREKKIENVNRTELALAVGLSRTFVSLVIAGKRTPSLKQAKALADGLGVGLEEFYGWLEGKQRGMVEGEVEAAA